MRGPRHPAVAVVACATCGARRFEQCRNTRRRTHAQRAHDALAEVVRRQGGSDAWANKVVAS